MKRNEVKEINNVGKEDITYRNGWYYNDDFNNVVVGRYDNSRFFCDIREKHGVNRLIRNFICDQSKKVSKADVWENSILIRKEGPTYFVNKKYVDKLSIDEMGKFLYLSKNPYVYGDIIMYDGSVKQVYESLSRSDVISIVHSNKYKNEVNIVRNFDKVKFRDDLAFTIQLSTKYTRALTKLMVEQAEYVDTCFKKLYQHFTPIYHELVKTDTVRKALNEDGLKAKIEDVTSNKVYDYSFVPTNSRAKKALEAYEKRLAKRWIEEARADQEERRRVARQKDLDKRAALQSIERYSDKEVEADIESMLYEEEYSDLIKSYKKRWNKSCTLLRATGNSCVFVSDYSGRYSGYRRSGFGSFGHHATDSNLDDIIGFMEDGLYDDPDHNIY